MIVQFGGQTPLKLAVPLSRPACRSSARRPTRSTSPRTASASARCSTKLGLASRPNGIARSADEAVAIAERHRLPGAGAAVLRARRPRDGDRVRRRGACAATCSDAVEAAPERPVLIDQFLEDAIEVDVDAVADGDDAWSSAASWSTSRRPASTPATRRASLPPHSLAPDGHRRDPSPDRGARARARRRRADERAVRRQGRATSTSSR